MTLIRFLPVPALPLAFLTLRGWPAGWSDWERALLACASVGLSLFVAAWLKPVSSVRGFKRAAHGHGLDRAANLAVVALGLAVLYVFLLAGPSAALQVTAALQRLGDRGSSSAEHDEEEWETYEEVASAQGSGSQLPTGVETVFDPAGAELPGSMDLAPSDKPEVRLVMDSADDATRLRQSGAAYVTAFSHDTFDGRRWTSQPAADSQWITADRDGLIPIHRERGSGPAFRYSVLHARLGDGLDSLRTLQGTEAVRLPALRHVSLGVYLIDSPDVALSYHEYEALSSPLRFETLVERGVSIEAGDVAPAFLNSTTHAGLRNLIGDLSDRIPSERTLEQRLSELQHWLRNTYSYSVELDYPDNDKCVLENFLGDPDKDLIQAGCCLHFASAAALMARELGAPSRISYGWAGGQYFAPERQFIFRSQHAHAWAEVYLRDYGWVIFDTTPSGALPQTTGGAPGESPPGVEEFFGEPGQSETAGDQRATLTLSPKWLMGAGALAVLALLALAGCKLRKSSTGTGKPSPTDAAPSPGYLMLFLQASSRLGQPMPPGRTLNQHVLHLRAKRLEPQFAGELLTYHYDVTYRNTPRSARAEKRLSQQIRTWNPQA